LVEGSHGEEKVRIKKVRQLNVPIEVEKGGEENGSAV
jgi:hypothetical protein